MTNDVKFLNKTKLKNKIKPDEFIPHQIQILCSVNIFFLPSLPPKNTGHAQDKFRSEKIIILKAKGDFK